MTIKKYNKKRLVHKRGIDDRGACDPPDAGSILFPLLRPTTLGGLVDEFSIPLLQLPLHLDRRCLVIDDLSPLVPGH